VRVLLTGGTGFLGRAVARALASRGHELVLFGRTASRSGLPGTAVDGDVRDAVAFQRAAAGCDALVHSAALVSIWQRHRRDFDDVNVGGLHHAIRAARGAGISRIVYTSSFLALPPYGERAPIVANDYQRTKLAADRLAEDAVRDGCPLVRLYPGVVYGPGSMTEGNLVGRLIADHLAGRLPGVVGPERPWSFAFVDDVARGHVEALERGAAGARYALGGENAPQRRVFELVSALTGRKPPRRIPFVVASALGLAEEWRAVLFAGRLGQGLGRRLGGPPLITSGAVEIFRHDWSMDSTDAVRDLGYTMTPLADGIRSTLAFLTAAGATNVTTT
jgi:farnesol dehydrogenase